jgi:hypothetical protein
MSFSKPGAIAMVQADSPDTQFAERDARSLYEQDILLWVEDTVTKLKARDFEHLDIDHLIEEVEALGISQRKELLSRLTCLLEHLLKRMYVNLPHDYNGWERTIRNQRRELDILLDQVPSLKSQWNDSFDNAWKRSLRLVQKEYSQTYFPTSWPFEHDIERMLEVDFWQNER